MGRARQLLTLLGKRGPNYAATIQALAPYIWYRYNEASGNIINYGSAASATGTANNLTYAQTGIIGVADAAQHNGSSSSVAVASVVDIAAVKSFTWALLLRPTDGNGRRMVSTTGATNWLRFEVGGSQVNCRIGATGVGQSTSAAITLDVWRWLWMVYDDAGSRIPRLYTSTGGAVTDITGTPIASTGTLPDITGFSVGSGGGTFFQGWIDEFLLLPLLTVDQMQRTVDASFL